MKNRILIGVAVAALVAVALVPTVSAAIRDRPHYRLTLTGQLMQFPPTAVMGNTHYAAVTLTVKNEADVPLENVDVRVTVGPCDHYGTPPHFRLYGNSRYLPARMGRIDTPFNGRWVEWHLSSVPAANDQPKTLTLLVLDPHADCMELDGAVDYTAAASTQRMTAQH